MPLSVRQRVESMHRLQVGGVGRGEGRECKKWWTRTRTNKQESEVDFHPPVPMEPTCWTPFSFYRMQYIRTYIRCDSFAFMLKLGKFSISGYLSESRWSCSFSILLVISLNTLIGHWVLFNLLSILIFTRNTWLDQQSMLSKIEINCS